MAANPNFETDTSMSKAAINQTTIKQLTVTASLFGGHIFGGYLRSMIQADWTPSNITLKYIDIWFKTQAKADRFVAATKTFLVPSEGSGYSHNLGDWAYPFTRQQYVLRLNDAILAFVDIIVAAKFPVNDFDVNILSARNVPGLPIWECQTHCSEFSIPYISEKIKRKEAQMLSSYLESFTSGPQWRMYHHASRVSGRYLAQGWKISMPDGTPLAPESNSPAHVLGFIEGWAMAQSTATATPPAPIDTKESPGSNMVSMSTSHAPIDSLNIDQITRGLAEAIERKHEAAILALMSEIQASATRGPPAFILESIKLRVRALMGETRQDLLKVLTVVQTCQDLLGSK